jgi:hypothetical protein
MKKIVANNTVGSQAITGMTESNFSYVFIYTE